MHKLTRSVLCQAVVTFQVYVPEAMQPLLECIRRVSTPASTILLAKYKRFAPASEQFWKLLPDYFDFTKVPEADFGAKPQEDCIGVFKLVWRKGMCD